MATKTADQIISEIAAVYAESEIRRFEVNVDDCGTESPIQKVMAAALLCVMKRDHELVGGLHLTELSYCFKGMKNELSFENYDFKRRYLGICIHPEFLIGKYRADFFVDFSHPVHRGRVFGAIECDGHDFHERTKEQAAHDKARDRYFQSLGLIVLRYTGSEIWRDAIKCASDAMATFDKLADAKAA